MVTLFPLSSACKKFQVIFKLYTQDNYCCGGRADILMLFLAQDPNLLRSYVVRTEGTPLLGLLVIFCMPFDCSFSCKVFFLAFFSVLLRLEL